MVLELLGGGLERLKDDMRRPAADLAVGYVSVLDGDDGIILILRLKVMDDDLAVFAELSGKPLCKSFHEVYGCCILHVIIYFRVDLIFTITSVVCMY